jgi:protein gp37
VSEGCRNCYAERIAKRFWRNGVNGDNYRPFSEVRCHPERLEEPKNFKPGSRVFVCSMSDLFHKVVPDKFINQVFWCMQLYANKTYLILTKRPERMHDFLTKN